jgi:hypothetical protein
MTVFLVPVGAGRHALYCEVKEPETELVDTPPGSSWRDRMVHRFRTTVADAEAEREREELGEAPRARGGPGRWIVRKIAEAVAEQRLLWHLRGASEGRLVHPDDLSGRDALRMARAEFTADYKKHLTRGVVNGVLSGVLGVVFFFVPGPNLVAYYFLFLAIGHYFALRGAFRGLRGVAWSTESSKPLAEIRETLALDPASRRATLERITTDLGLSRLWRFVERVGHRPA